MSSPKTSLGASLDSETRDKLAKIAHLNLQNRVEHLFFFIKERIEKDSRGYASFGDKCFSQEEMAILKKLFNIEITPKNLICFKLVKL